MKDSNEMFIELPLNLKFTPDGDFKSYEDFEEFIKNEYDLNAKIKDYESTVNCIFSGDPDKIRKYLKAYTIDEDDLLSEDFKDIKEAYLAAINSDNEDDYVKWVNT